MNNEDFAREEIGDLLFRSYRITTIFIRSGAGTRQTNLKLKVGKIRRGSRPGAYENKGTFLKIKLVWVDKTREPFSFGRGRILFEKNPTILLS